MPAPKHHRSNILDNFLFCVKTAKGNMSALMEHMCKGKYSKGDPHATKLKVIAPIPLSDKMNKTIFFVLIDLFFKIKNKFSITCIYCRFKRV